jgi:SAM-dependent methyltransferase
MVEENRTHGTFKIDSAPFIGRIHILARLVRFALRSLWRRDFDYFANAVCSIFDLFYIMLKDLFFRKNIVQCSICGWTGSSFYRHTGSGYDGAATLCPGCLCQDRHRTLLFILQRDTDFFVPGKRIVEVAPERNLEKLYLSSKQLNYTSFDIERHAMEQGDITRMRYEDNSVDYFLCLHVLEHVSKEQDALQEIRRILKPDGYAIIQVPVDWDLEHGFEYLKADPRDTYHVRRYGRDFLQKLLLPGFQVVKKIISDCLTDEEIRHYGCSMEPLFFFKKTASD